jgi:hypothetical protein
MIKQQGETYKVHGIIEEELDEDAFIFLHERLASRPPAEVHLSQLQEKILKFVCTRPNVDYVTLTKETKRDRVTVSQSVDSLVNHHLVSKDKSDPEYEKSKVIVKATLLGKHYSVNILKVNLEDILKVEDDKFISDFLEFIKDIPALQRRKLIEPLHDLFLYLYYIWIHDYKTKRKDELIKRILKAGLKTGIHELMRDETYDADNLFNKRSIESLKRLFGSQEIKELHQYIVHMKNNIIATEAKFPK